MSSPLTWFVDVSLTGKSGLASPESLDFLGYFLRCQRRMSTWYKRIFRGKGAGIRLCKMFRGSLTFSLTAPSLMKGMNDMTDIKETVDQAHASPEPSEPEAAGLIMRSGGTTFLIGLHFSETSKDTLDDKVKKLIRKNVEDGNF